MSAALHNAPTGLRRLVVALVAAMVVNLLPVIAPPAWAQPPEGDPVERVGGTDRIATSVAVSNRFFSSAETIVLATAGRFPDALAAGPLARVDGAPILLTPSTTLPATVADEIQRLGATRAVIVGGESAVGPAVADALGELDVEVQRLAGPERFATAGAVFDWLAASAQPAATTLARGRGETEDDGFADALTAGTLGILDGVRPTLLTEQDRLPEPSLAALDGQADGLIVGGPAAVSEGVAATVDGVVETVERVAGPNRAATSVAVAERVIAQVGPPTNVLIVTGSTFPDSLVAGALTRQLGAPILLVPSDLASGFRQTEDPVDFESAAPEVTTFLREHCETIERATILGLQAAVSAGVEEAVARLINCNELDTPVGVADEPDPDPTPDPTDDPTPDPVEDPTPDPDDEITPPPGGVIVPDVVGLPQGEGMAQITGADLVPAAGGSRHDDSPAGTILEQEPPGGVEVGRRTPVEVVVSLGPALLTIPDVIGQDEAAARSTIEGAGFAVGIVGQGEFDADGIDPGEVGRQLPLAGQQALPGTPVDVDLSTGGVNDPPVITSEPDPLTHTTGTPWQYDTDATDPDGDPITYVLQSGPDGATVSSTTGLVEWDPDSPAAGLHDFAIRAEDGRGGIDVQSFTLAVRVPNRAPVATDDVYTAFVDEVLQVGGSTRAAGDPGVLDNDADPDDDPLSAALMDPPTSGSVDLQGDGSFTYTPATLGITQTYDDIDLTRYTSQAVTAASEFSATFSAQKLIDEDPFTEWFATSPSSPGDWTIELTFDHDVTIDTVALLGTRVYAGQGYAPTGVTIDILDEAGSVLATDLPVTFDAGNANRDPDGTLDVSAVNGSTPAGARGLRIMIQGTAGQPYPGIAEIRVVGDGPVTEPAPAVEWSATGSGVQVTPSVADLDGDGTTEVISSNNASALIVLDGTTGLERWRADDRIFPYSTSPVVADFVTDIPGLEIAVTHRTADPPRSTIGLYGADGVELHRESTGAIINEGNMAAADLDGDGVTELVVPQSIGDGRIVAYSFVRDDSGPSVLATRTQEWVSPQNGCGNNNGYRENCIPIVADVDLDGAPEVIAGTALYRGVDGTLIETLDGVTGMPADGWTAVGNFDDDPEGEIVVVQAGAVWLFNHDLTPVWDAPFDLTSGRGGAPTVSDLDGDGQPEIGVAGGSQFEAIDTDGSLLWSMPVRDPSGATGSTVFDFDGDGRVEVVYRDQGLLWIFDGSTGRVRARQPIASSTTVESPVVADIDDDGGAEILVSSDGSTTLGDGDTVASSTLVPPGLYAYGAPFDNWVRARGIWNQHSYHVTNVNADGTVPAVESVNWLTAGLNHFRQNTFLPDEVSSLDSFTYEITDGGQTDQAEVFIDARPVQNAPQFTCDPDPIAVIGFPYRSRVCADDPDGGPLTFDIGDRPRSVVVPGTANPFLSAHPDGTTASSGDVAPDHSPTWVDFLELDGGQELTFSATGWTSHTGAASGPGPDGISNVTRGEERGIAGYSMPINALVGVFLGPDIPADPATPPSGLDFSTPASRNQPLLAPDVEQTFFIGDGRADDGTQQRIVVPDGATRLYLGSSDGFGWYNNTGQFEVTIEVEGASGPSIDPGTGLLSWTPGQADSGTRVYVFEVVDETGRRTFDFRQITVVHPVTVPGVVGEAEAAATTAIQAAGLRVGDVQVVHDTSTPVGAVVSQSLPGGSVARPDDRVDLTVSAGPAPGDEDADGDGVSPNQGDCDDDDDAVNPGASDTSSDGVDQNCDGIDGVPPTLTGLTIQPGDIDLIGGETVTLRAVASYDDGSTRDVTNIAAWRSGAAGTARVDQGDVTGVAGGAVQITVDLQGESASITATVRVPVPGDRTPPSVAISTPDDGAQITQPTEVIGTVVDNDLLRWTLDLVDGDDAVATVATGAAGVADGVLGQIDPTLLFNGARQLRLTATDVTGNTAAAVVGVVLDGQMKPGAFTLAVTDLSVPVPGISLDVARQYDSRRTEVGDFGRGWDLGLGEIDVSVDGVHGEGWAVTGGGFRYDLQATRPHIATVRLPDGRIEQFRAVPSPSRTAFIPPTFATMSYQRLPGTSGALTPLGNTNVLVLGGGGGGAELADDLSGRPWQAAGFRYTTGDGITYEIDAVGAVQTVVDADGNRIQLTDAGLIHSAGRSVLFDRDSSRRIVSVTDPDGNAHTYGYDAVGNLTRHTDPGGNTTRYRYDGDHNLVQITDPLGRVVDRREYDADGRLIAVTDRAGNRISLDHQMGLRREAVTDAGGDTVVYDYDARGNIVQVTDPLGGVTTNTYDAADNQLTTTDPVGNTTTRTFDGRGNVLTETDPAGATTTFTYDAAGRMASREDPLGRTSTFVRDSAGNILRETQPDGSLIERSYDTRGELVTQTIGGATTQLRRSDAGLITEEVDPLGRTRTLSYTDAGRLQTIVGPAGGTTALVTDARGQVSQVTDPTGATTGVDVGLDGQVDLVTDALGNTVETVRDVAGNAIEVRLPGGAVITNTFDADGNLTSTRQPDGATTTTTYDALGNVTSEVDAAGGTTSHTYDAAGRRTSTTGPRGGTTTFVYDTADRLVSQTDAAGGTTGFGYDPAGNLVSQTDPVGGTTVHVYDALDRVIRTTHADATETTHTYDAAGNRTSTTTPAGTTTFTYDAADQLVRVTDAVGAVTTATYDAAGNQTSITDAEGRTTRYAYDAVGRLVRTTFPLGSTEVTEYDAVGNVIRHVDRTGIETLSSYDAQGRLVSQTIGGDPVMGVTYSPAGLQSSLTTPEGTIAFNYDPVGRPTAVMNPDGSSLTYAYDAAGNRTSMTVQIGPASPPLTTTYAYDPANRMASVQAPDGAQVAITHDAAGRRQTVSRSNGTDTDYVHDARHRTSSILHRNGGVTLSRLDYERDVVGNPTRIIEGDGSQSVFTYDALGRLTSEDHQPASGTALVQSYTYDGVSNRLTRTDAVGTTTSTYDADDRLVSRDDGVTWTYDRAGRQLSRSGGDGTQLLGYDRRGLLSSSRAADGTTDTFALDPLGSRVGVGASSLVVDPFAPTSVPEVVAEFDASGVVATFTHSAYGLEVQTLAGTTSYVHADDLGSTRLLTDAAGAPAGRARWSAFGEALEDTLPSAMRSRFTGERRTPSTGLYHLRARQYDPGTGRFTSVDPDVGGLEVPDSRHPYLYTEANPLTGTDPTGRFTKGAVELSVVTAIAVGLSAALFAPTGTTAIDRAKRAVIAGSLAGISTLLTIELIAVLGGAVFVGVLAFGLTITSFASALSGAVGAALLTALAITLVIAITSNCITALINDGACDLGATAISTTLVTLATLGLASRLPSATLKPLANAIYETMLDLLPPFATDYLTNAFSS